MNSQINNVIRGMYMELKNISNIRYLIDVNTTSRLVVSLVLSKLDYCNSLLIGTSEKNKLKLQRLQNNAARLILKKRKRDDASPLALLRSLRWLPVENKPRRHTDSHTIICSLSRSPLTLIAFFILI